MENKRSTSFSTIPSYRYDGLCDYGDLCSSSLPGRPHSYSNEILRWSKKELEAYQKSIEDDACSQYRETISSPLSYSYLNGKDPPLKIINFVYDSPTKMTPLSPSAEEDPNLVVPDTPEEVLVCKAKKTPKKGCYDCKAFIFMFFNFIVENNRKFGL